MQRRTMAHAWRSLAVAVVSTYAALTGHLLGGGQLPSVLGLALPLALSVLGCLVLSGRTPSLARMALSVAVSQGLFHALFMVGTMTAHASAGLDAGGHAGHVTSLAITATDEGMDHPMVPMWLGHAIAGAATLAFLRRADLALSLLLELGRAVLRPLFLVLRRICFLPPCGLRNRQLRPRIIALSSQTVLSVSSPRGPPPALMSSH